MQITKIKIDEKSDKIAISYKAGDDEIEHKKDLKKFGMMPSFKSAVEKLKTHFLKICEADASAESRTTIYGCTFTYWKDTGKTKEVDGICISAGIQLLYGTGVVCMTSPHRINQFYADNGDDGQLMPDGLNQDMQLLKDEIIKYLNGNWVCQKDLFNADKDDVNVEISTSLDPKPITIKASKIKELADFYEKNNVIKEQNNG